MTVTHEVPDTDQPMIPDGVQYDRLAVIQNVALEGLLDRVRAIEAKLKALD